MGKKKKKINTNFLKLSGKKLTYQTKQNLKTENNSYPSFHKIVKSVINPDAELTDGKYSSSVYEEMSNLENDVFINLNQILKCNNINNNFSNFSEKTLFTTGVSIINNIAVVVLNSAWLNVDSSQCHGQLVLGTPIIHEILNELKNGKFIDASGNSVDGKYVITLLHNDFNWHSISDHHFNAIQQGDNNSNSSIATITQFSDIILCGHEHKETLPTLLGLDAYVLKVGGTFRTLDSHTDNTFSVYTLDFAFNTLTREVYSYEYNDLHTWAWKKNTVNDDFVTELKPKDAKERFKTPHRIVDDCFEIMKKNNLLQKKHNINTTFKEYLMEHYDK